MIKAILFDMDGVLIDAKEWHYDALNRALRLFGFQISRYDHLTTFDGLPTSKKLEMLSLERGLPRGLHRFINEMKQLYTLQIVHAKCTPTFVHEYALASLKNRGYQLAVGSNSVRNSVHLMLEKACLLQFFDAVMSNEDVNHPKPNPEIYLALAARLNVKPQECMVVEDNPHGVRAARDAGASVMVVRDVHDVYLDAILHHINLYNENC